MPQRQGKLRDEIDTHLKLLVEKHKPSCSICGEGYMHEEGKFSMIGTEPRGPRTMGSLKCPMCGAVIFVEIPDAPQQ